MKNVFTKLYLILLINFLVFSLTGIGLATPFVHPGGLHTSADLERMKTNVLAGNHPWIDDWQKLLRDPQPQTNWQIAAPADMRFSRQRADLDAHAAYLNTLRWYISGDTNYAEHAVKICNAWAAGLHQVSGWNDTPGLNGIAFFNFALVGEFLRIYPGWSAEDFNGFTNTMVRYWYPVCHDFLVNHNGRCDSFYWANWDACNIGALLAMGVLCDDTNIFNEGVEYFKHGKGMGSISNAVPFLYADNLGQWQESGRDQEHTQLGVGLLGSACQVAWNQGLDLFSYADNRLLAGAEYVAKCNLSYLPATIPYTFYDNCSDARQFYLAPSQMGRLDARPVWELIYNHYAVIKGLATPYSKAMAQLVRPERGSGDHFGYGTLTFTMQAAASPFPPNPIPPVPTGVKAEAGVSQVFLNWEKSDSDTAQGYIVRRSINANGPFVKIAAWNNNTATHYTDNSITNGTMYYYVVAATNQAGASANSESTRAQPAAAGPLQFGWTNADIGLVGSAGSATYAAAGENTFIARGAGGNISGKSDAFNFTYRILPGDFIFSARLVSAHWSGRDKIGLMVRESLAPEAKTVALTLGDLGNRQCQFGTRAETSAAMISRGGDDYTVPRVWFKIQRTGNVLAGFQSVDGTNWFKVGDSIVTMTNQCFVGLAIAGQKKEVFNISDFDHVIVQKPPGR